MSALVSLLIHNFCSVVSIEHGQDLTFADTKMATMSYWKVDC